MRPCISLAAIAAVALSASSAAAQSGFLKAQGSGYVKMSFSTISSDAFYDTSGERISFGGSFTQRNLSLYGEVGVLPFLTAGVSAPVLRLNSFDTSDTAVGLGDAQVFAKTGYQWLGFHGALILGAELPTGRSEALVDTEFEGVRSNLPTGDGEANFWFTLALSRPLPTPDFLPAYASAFVGYNLRTKYSNQVDAGAEVGVQLFGFLWLQGKVAGRFRTVAVEDLDPAGTFLFGEGTEYVAGSFGASAQIPSTPLSVTLDVQNTFARLRNLYAGTTVGVGLAADW